MNGIFFVLRTGTPWRDLPERYGPYTTCFSRYNRWSRNGTWAAIMEKLQGMRAMTTGATTARPARFACAWWTPRRCASTSAGRGATAGRAEPRRTDDEGPSRHRRERDGEDRVPDPGARQPTARRRWRFSPGSGMTRRREQPRPFRRGPAGSCRGRSIGRPTGRAISSNGSSARSRSSAGSPRATTRPPATSCPPSIWLPAGSCSAGSQTSHLSPRPKIH